QVVDGPTKVQFALGNDKRSHENEHGVNNRVEVSAAPSHEVNGQNLHNMDVNKVQSLMMKYLHCWQKVQQEFKSMLAGKKLPTE
nr:protein kinase, ATP binding site-containing protein [Tanacetum cinerariifolium]